MLHKSSKINHWWPGKSAFKYCLWKEDSALGSRRCCLISWALLLCLTWGCGSEGACGESSGPHRHPWCSLCCQSAWIRSGAHPWWAGRAAGAVAPEKSWRTGRGRRGREPRGWRRKRKQTVKGRELRWWRRGVGWQMRKGSRRWKDQTEKVPEN